MKNPNSDQSQHTEGDHEKSHKQEATNQKMPHPTAAQQPKENRAANREAEAHKGLYHVHEGFDHETLEKLNDELANDQGLRDRFQKEPDAVLQERGIAVPEGFKANYDQQFVKPSDGSKAGLFGYRIGNINFTK
jgi:hypothetical protein